MGFWRLRSLPEFLRESTASGFLLYEIDFHSRGNWKTHIFHLALLYKLRIKYTKSQVFMICRGLEFSLEESKESRCWIFFEKSSAIAFHYRTQLVLTVLGGTRKLKIAEIDQLLSFPIQKWVFLCSKKSQSRMGKDSSWSISAILSPQVPPRIVEIIWVL